MQSKLIVKTELVATKGYKLVVSGLSCNTLNVQQFPSNFSTLNTLEHPFELPSHVEVESLVVGILQGTFPPPQVYIITGLVLQDKQVGPPPSIGLSHESKQLSPQTFCCNTRITPSISAMQLVSFSLHIINHPFLYLTINLCLILKIVSFLYLLFLILL
jgi:hypothetical protein